MLVAVLFSVLGAFLFAAAAAIQQRAASEASRREAVSSSTSSGLTGVRLIRRLVRDRRWLLGWLANLGGFCSQAVALHFGSVGIVQPLLVSQLLFAMFLTTVGTRRRPCRQDIIGALAICAGLAVLMSVRGAAPPAVQPDRARLLAIAPGVAAVTLALSLAARSRRGVVVAAMRGVAAGVFFACSAVLIQLTTHDLFDRGVAETARDWPGYALALSTGLGLLLEQEAFAAGPLPAALSAMNITNPVVSYLVGVLAVHIPAPTSPGTLSGIAAAGALLVVGITVLSHSPSLHTYGGHSQQECEVCPRPGRGLRAATVGR